MQLVRRFRLHALFCALAVLLCALASHPYANMGVADDGTYIRSAQRLLATGHILYNGVETPMLGWQLYLGAAFIKLFGFSFTAVRSSTLLVALLTAFLLQRTLALTGIRQLNATLGTLALALSPLYLMLSVTYMTDIFGLFAVLVCLYGCLRALEASADRAAIGWLCFAVATNAIFGTARQVAWLGALVMVPSVLWLLRGRRRVLLAGAGATLAGAIFILACMQWLRRQPYFVPSPLFGHNASPAHALGQLCNLLLDIPFLMLPISAIFLPELFVAPRGGRTRIFLTAILFVYIVVAVLTRHHHPLLLLEPASGNDGGWVGVKGVYQGMVIRGLPFFLHVGSQTLLTIVSLGGLLGVVAVALRTPAAPNAPESFDLVPETVTWAQLRVLFLPFSLAYVLLLLSAAFGGATVNLYDRYALDLLPLFLLWSVRFYQERVSVRLPARSVVLILTMAIYGIAATHNTFAIYRARVALADELEADGVPSTAVDYGWEYNFQTELRYADHLNDPRIRVPEDAYVSAGPLPARSCSVYLGDRTPHVHPIYGVSFDLDACYGPAPFAPVHYSRWLAKSPGTLYVVRYLPLAKQ